MTPHRTPARLPVRRPLVHLARDAGLMVTDRVWPRDAAKGATT